MPDVAVVTDTTHYLPPETVAELGVREVSLYVNDGERQQREADIRDLAAFYDRLRTAASLPTTSQPSIGDFLAALRAVAGRRPRHRLDPHLGRHLGHRRGRPAGGRRAGRVRFAHRGHRLQAGLRRARDGRARHRGGRACRGRRRGRRGARSRAAGATRLWFAVDTLEYLRRGGRIGAAQAWLGGALKIKPILTLDGEITPIERVRTSGRAFERMVEYLRTRHDDGADGWVVQHIQAPDQAERLWSSAGARSSAASRCSSRRSARSSAPTSARACSAWGGIPPGVTRRLVLGAGVPCGVWRRCAAQTPHRGKGSERRSERRRSSSACVGGSVLEHVRVFGRVSRGQGVIGLSVYAACAGASPLARGPGTSADTLPLDDAVAPRTPRTAGGRLAAALPRPRAGTADRLGGGAHRRLRARHVVLALHERREVAGGEGVPAPVWSMAVPVAAGTSTAAAPRRRIRTPSRPRLRTTTA